MEPNRSKGKSDYSLTNTSLGFLASKRITIKNRLWLFLDLLASYPCPVFQPWSSTGTETRLCSGSTFCSRGHNSVPVIPLHKYLHCSPCAQLPFSQKYANCSKTKAFGQVQDEWKAKERRSHQGGILLLPSHGLLWGQDFTWVPCSSLPISTSCWSWVGLTPT